MRKEQLFLFLFLFAFVGGCIGSDVSENKGEENYVVVHTDCVGCHAAEKETNTQSVVEQKSEQNKIEQSNETAVVDKLPEAIANITENLQNISKKESKEEQQPTENSNESKKENEKCVGPTNYEDVYTQASAVYEYRVYEDQCIRWDTVKKFYCENNILKDINLNCPPGYWCKNGACIKFVGSCTDSDGTNTSVKGYVDIVTSPFSSIRETDACIDDMDLYEWVCEEEKGVQLRLACQSGSKCVEGKCVRSKCKEIDGGNNPLVFSKIQNEFEEYEDKCIENKILREYYCFADSIRWIDIKCADECIDGSCKPKEE